MKIPDWFASLPAGRQAVAEAEAVAEGDRSKLLDEQTRIQERLAKTTPSLDAALTTALEKERLALAALRECGSATAVARAALTSVTRAAEARIVAIDRELRATADPSLAALAGEVETWIGDLRMGRRFVARGVILNAALPRLMELFRDVRDALPLLPTADALKAAEKVRVEVASLLEQRAGAAA